MGLRALFTVGAMGATQDCHVLGAALRCARAVSAPQLRCSVQPADNPSPMSGVEGCAGAGLPAKSSNRQASSGSIRFGSIDSVALAPLMAMASIPSAPSPFPSMGKWARGSQ